jgi:hypothetical protein
MKVFKKQELANTVWAFAHLQYSPSEAMWGGVNAAVAAQAPEFTPQNLSNILWGYATLSQTPFPPLMAKLERQMARELQGFKPQVKYDHGPIVLLATRGVYSHSLSSYWSHVVYIPMYLPPIGHTWSIFSFPVLLLVTRGVYSHLLASHWPHVEYILIPCPPIGHTWSIFSFPVLLLVTRGVYSHLLASHWSHTGAEHHTVGVRHSVPHAQCGAASGPAAPDHSQGDWPLNVPRMFPECALNVPSMFPQCSLKIR